MLADLEKKKVSFHIRLACSFLSWSFYCSSRSFPCYIWSCLKSSWWWIYSLVLSGLTSVCVFFPPIICLIKIRAVLLKRLIFEKSLLTWVQRTLKRKHCRTRNLSSMNFFSLWKKEEAPVLRTVTKVRWSPAKRRMFVLCCFPRPPQNDWKFALQASSGQRVYKTPFEASSVMILQNPVPRKQMFFVSQGFCELLRRPVAVAPSQNESHGWKDLTDYLSSFNFLSRQL